MTGEMQVWNSLEMLEPEDVCLRAMVTYDTSSGLYILKSFAYNISVSVENNEITGDYPPSVVLFDELDTHFKLSILHYMLNVKDIPLSGKLVKPADLTGGQIYLQGTHVLPLDNIAEKYGSDIEGFIEKGRQVGGERLDCGDASIRLFPFPRVPVVIILWGEDDEFPSRSTLLLDSTCEFHLPPDIIWSIATMSVKIML